MKTIAAPSILAVWDQSGEDPAAVVKAAQEVVKAGATWVHIDVMDGRYVPRLTFGAEMVKALHAKLKNVELDVHLMVEEPGMSIEDHLKAGATRIVFHPSASRDVRGRLQLIKDGGAVAGLALNVGEGLDLLEPYKDEVEQVLVMTVEAGAGGQPLREDMLEKIKAVRQLLGPNACIVADGGINGENAAKVRSAGANVLVAGSFVFKAESLPEALAALQA